MPENGTPPPGFPDRKISETFLDFASPLLDALGAGVTKGAVEEALKIAFLVWNSAVYDRVDGTSENVGKVRKAMGADPASEALVEMMISRKQSMFADDLRLIGKYEITMKKGKHRLRVEARAPGTGTRGQEGEN